MSSAVGRSTSLHHSAAGTGEHVHASAGTPGSFSLGVVPPPFDAPFSMAQHFAALTFAHGAVTKPNESFGEVAGGTTLLPSVPVPTNPSSPLVFSVPDVVDGATAMATDAHGVASGTTGDKGDSLKHMQQRLLLLRHASRCEAHGEKCSVTRHCRNAKELWNHLHSCSNPRCQTAHCVSSRYVLSHYHRCQDLKCAVCAPVREVIAKSRRGRGPCE